MLLSSPARIDNQFLMKLDAFREFRQRRSQECQINLPAGYCTPLKTSTNDTPEEAMERIYKRYRIRSRTICVKFMTWEVFVKNHAILGLQRLCLKGEMTILLARRRQSTVLQGAVNDGAIQGPCDDYRVPVKVERGEARKVTLAAGDVRTVQAIANL